MSKADKHYAINRAKRIIRESFTDPSGKYDYKQVKADAVEPSDTYGFRVTGTLWIKSPKFTGDTYFLALTTAQCHIEQVRINGLVALSLQIRDILMHDNRLWNYFR